MSYVDEEMTTKTRFSFHTTIHLLRSRLINLVRDEISLGILFIKPFPAFVLISKMDNDLLNLL